MKKIIYKYLTDQYGIDGVRSSFVDTDWDWEDDDKKYYKNLLSLLAYDIKIIFNQNDLACKLYAGLWLDKELRKRSK